MNSKTTTTTPTKLISKNNNSGKANNKKFFICCRPPLTPLVAINMKDTGSVCSVQSCDDGGREPHENQGGEFPEAAFSEGDGESIFTMEVKDAKRKKKGGKKKLLRALKKAFFATSLAQKIGRRKLAQKLCQTKAKLSTEPPKSLNENSVYEESYHDENGNGKAVSTASSTVRSSSTLTTSSMCTSTCSSSTVTSSSTCCSSLASNLRNNVTDISALFPVIAYDKKVQKQDNNNNNVKEHGKGCCGPNTGLCFLLISLLVLVFWGKLCAIFCTSTWLFFVPRWTIGNKSENFTNDPSKLDWDKKKNHNGRITREERLPQSIATFTF